MTPAEIKQRVRDRLDEDQDNSARYPDGLTQVYLLDGVRAYVLETGCQMATVTITQTANTLFYDLPCDCIQVQRVLWNSDSALKPLNATTTRDLDSTIYQWQHMADVRARSYFLLGLDKLALWPMSADGGEEYVVEYRRDVYTGLTVMPEQDHGLIIDYCIGRHQLTEGKAAEATMHLGIFAEGVKAARNRMANSDRMWQLNGKGL